MFVRVQLALPRRVYLCVDTCRCSPLAYAIPHDFHIYTAPHDFHTCTALHFTALSLSTLADYRVAARRLRVATHTHHRPLTQAVADPDTAANLDSVAHAHPDIAPHYRSTHPNGDG